MISRITISTGRKTEVLNVTEACRSLIRTPQSGIALFYIPHTTAALIVSEDDDELRADIARISETWLAIGRPFAHIRNNNPNAEAHILSAFGGASVAVAVEDGRLDLGTYQNILLLEMDGPKQREIRCQFIGE